jgi:N-acetylglucosaminyl-diphospho-decaprenol L-rhamnosyltransferase
VLDQFLSSLETASSHPLDNVVVDNASSESAEMERQSRGHGARFLALDQNGGYGAGMNAGFAQLGPDVEFAVLANPDIVFEPGSIDTLFDLAGARPDAGALGPRILTPDGETYPSARRLPSLREGIGHVLFLNIWPSNPWTRSYRQELMDVSEREVGWLSGACLLVRTETFRAVGGFDSSFFMYFEDVDLGARIGRSGFVNLYAPTAVVTHIGAHSTQQSKSQMSVAHHESAYLYLSRKYSAWYLWPLRAALRLGLALRQRMLAARS